jgi:hypothetical protein
MVYAKLWASDATDTSEKLSDPNPLTPTERDALAQVHNNIISCRQTIISDNSRSEAWKLPYWLDYFKRSDLSLINWQAANFRSASRTS